MFRVLCSSMVALCLFAFAVGWFAVALLYGARGG